MSCKSCQSDNQRNFNGELNIHFPGRKGWDKPTVWVFPPVTICVNCGCGEFMVHGEPLQQLKEHVTRSKSSNIVSAEPPEQQV